MITQSQLTNNTNSSSDELHIGSYKISNLGGKVIPIRNKKGDIIAKLQQGDIVNGVQVELGVYKISIDGGSVYVKSDYIDKLTHKDSIYKVVNTGAEGLAIRHSRDNSEGSFDVIPNGAEIEVLDMDGKWAKVLYKSQIGWSHSRYLQRPELSVSSINASQSSNSLNGFYNYSRGYEESHGGRLTNLRVDTYRGIDVNVLNEDLRGNGVLAGQGEAIATYCKKYNVDPVFFTAQAALESGHGHSYLASRATYNGVRVYNILGIGAFDSDPDNAARYAYNHGWTTPQKAIEGAVKFLSTNYVNSSKYQQNTPQRLIDCPTGYSNHYYCAGTEYPSLIASVMLMYQNAYSQGVTFQYE